MSPTVFSCAEYELTIGGVRIDSSRIVSAVLRREADNLPVRGTVTSVLELKIYSEEVFDPNGEIRFSCSGEHSFICPVHYISRIRGKGHIVTITAYDRMRKTDNPFDCGMYSREGEPYAAELVMGDLAVQCGMNGAVNVPQFDFYYDDLKGKSCREIIEMISEYGCGVWFCTDSGVLKFTEFLSSSSGVWVSDSSEMFIRSVKGPFTAVYGKNTSTGEVFVSGTASDFRNRLRIKGRVMTSARAGQIMGSIARRSFTAFYCGHIEAYTLPEGIAEYSFGERSFIACVTEAVFCGSGFYLRAYSEDICEDESDYSDFKDMVTDRKIEEGRKYGSVIMNGYGMGILDSSGEEDIRERNARYFSECVDCVSEFGGAVMDTVMPERIERTAENCRAIVYGGTRYVLEYDVDEDGNKENIRMRRERI